MFNYLEQFGKRYRSFDSYIFLFKIVSFFCAFYEIEKKITIKHWIKLFFESINSISYNYRELILSTWKLLKENEEIDNSDSECSEPDIKYVEYHPDNDSDYD